MIFKKNRREVFSVIVYCLLGISFLISFLDLGRDNATTFAGLINSLLARIFVEDFFGMTAFILPALFFYLAYLGYTGEKMKIPQGIMLWLAIFNLFFSLNVFFMNFNLFWNSLYAGYFPKLVHTIIVSKLGGDGLNISIFSAIVELVYIFLTLCFLWFFVSEKYKQKMKDASRKIDQSVRVLFKNVFEEFQKGGDVLRRLKEEEVKTMGISESIFIKRMESSEKIDIENKNIEEEKEPIHKPDHVLDIGSTKIYAEEDIISVSDIFENSSSRQGESLIDFPEINIEEEVTSLEIEDELLEMEEDLYDGEMPWSMVMNEAGENYSSVVGDKKWLHKIQKIDRRNSKEALERNARYLEETLKNFGIGSRVENVLEGPVVTQYQISIDAGIKVNKVFSLSDNLALALSATSVRVSFVPEKGFLGIEIPNEKRETVSLHDLVDSPSFKETSYNLPFALGKSIVGESVFKDFSEMPHLLIAGSTGSGKSVCVNSIISSLLMSSSPEQLRFVMIDPKMVELTIYNDIPHLLTPVITDHKKASKILKWVIVEMEKRYRLLEITRVRNIKGYNEVAKTSGLYKTMPYIVVVIDEFADLMLVARKEIEDSISRLAAMSRAVGIHLLLATQRPSVDVITGVIKANFPSRIAFQVSSKIDSRTILDESGAEQLLGKGDMLYSDPKGMGLQRIQCCFLSDEEIQNMTRDLRKKAAMKDLAAEAFEENTDRLGEDVQSDELYEEALEIIMRNQKASISFLQRKLKIGYNRAARIIEEMEDRGIISSEGDLKARKILVNR